MARTQSPRVAWIGADSTPEFAPALAWLNEQTALSRYLNCSAAASDLGSNGLWPTWIVFAAGRRSEFHTREVERLHRRTPLTRLVTLLGSWCEGEFRSGTPLPGVARVYWYEFIPRAQAELFSVQRPGYAGWSLPRTATAVEQGLLLTPALRLRKPSSDSLAIVSPTYDRYSALADASAACGTTNCHWLRDVRAVVEANPAAALYDGDRLDDVAIEELQMLVAALSPRPVVAAWHFPRWHEVARLQQIGVHNVLAKPFLLGDLAALLGSLRSSGQRATAA